MLAVMRTIRTAALLILSAALTFAADISGKWTFTVDLGGQGGTPAFEFTQKGEALTGMYHGQFGEAKLTGTVKGDKVEFTFGSEAGSVKYSGTIESATKISGTCDYGEAAGKGTFTGVKN
jgi:hypothetical protein